MRVLFSAPPARRAVWCLVIWCAALASIAPAAAAERRGGIEIGAKGVKATVVELDAGPGGPTSRTLMNEVSNTTVASGVVAGGRYAPQAIRETAAEAGKFAGRMREEFGVPPDKIQVIGSSGLPVATNKRELEEAVKEATGVRSMRFLTPCEEVGLTFAGLVAEAERPGALLVDVGSGNTKGGYLGSGGQAVCFSVPLGSVTFKDRVTREAPGQPFAEAADRSRPTLLEAPLVEQARANPELTARSLVILSGGAPYAMVTLTFPEKVREARVKLSARDIADYAQRLRAGASVPRPDLDAIQDPETRKAAEQEVRNVTDTFTRENLIAGAEILTALSSALKFEGKTLTFDRNGVTAWIRVAVSPVRAVVVPPRLQPPVPPQPVPSRDITSPPPATPTANELAVPPPAPATPPTAPPLPPAKLPTKTAPAPVYASPQ